MVQDMRAGLPGFSSVPMLREGKEMTPKILIVILTVAAIAMVVLVAVR